jgi:mono/diheme cytochrome c family protein
MDQATLTGIISKGLPGTAMPAFGNTLTGDQVTDLVAFIRSW